MSIQAGCAAATPLTPTEAVIVNTSTLATTSEPTYTPIPDATSTPTPTATITPTHTPDVTPTQIPEVPAPAKGKANVIGLVLWNDQPVGNVWVKLCEEFDSFGCSGNKYDFTTDQEGYFVFRDVVPGEYIVAIELSGTDWWQFYFNSQQSKSQKVSAGKNLILDPWNIYKIDLGVLAPKIEQNLPLDKPTLRWDAYPGAAYYEISMYNKKSTWILRNKRVDKNEFTPEQPMEGCKYFWYVEVYNSRGTLISRSDPGGAVGLDWYFTLYDLPTSCD